MQAQPVITTFEKLFNQAPSLLINAPGRINLIGEHTDYNNGFVLPAAINKSIVLAFSARTDDQIILYSLDMQEQCSITTQDFTQQEMMWANYMIGVLEQLQKRGYIIKGFNCAFGGDIPIGGGLSSSAALECGTAFGLNTLFDLGISQKEIALIGQAAENEFVGVKCGIMDQFANMFGKEGHVILLDCQTLDYTYYPLSNDDIDIVLLDTQVKHSLAGGEYNIRRQQCEAGVKAIQANKPQVGSLRDATMDDLEAVKQSITPVEYNRCKYVIEEIERIQAACNLLLTNDLKGFGQKMYETHKGLKELYEVSCPELDFLVEQALLNPAALGSRMMGGGFGGCTINIVPKHATKAFIEQALQAYQTQFNTPGEAYIVGISAGTKAIELK